MSLVETVNEFIKNNEYENISKLSITEHFMCDGECGKTFKKLVEGKESLYYHTANGHLIIMCEKCLDNESYKKNIEIVDRTEYTTKQKPLMWPCNFCGDKQGGGCKWYCNHISDIDMCMKCYKDDLFDKYTKIENVDKYSLSERNGLDPILMILEEVKELKVPLELKDKVTTERAEMWFQEFNELVCIDDKVTNICTWLPFTDVYEIPNFSASTMLVVNCDTKNNGQVASVVFDDQGRMAVNIIFDTFEEYQKELKEWDNNQLSEEKRVDLSDKVKSDFKKKHQADEEDMANTCEKFSGYVRLSRKLNMYYG
jgi:hypothetical protein